VAVIHREKTKKDGTHLWRSSNGRKRTFKFSGQKEHWLQGRTETSQKKKDQKKKVAGSATTLGGSNRPGRTPERGARFEKKKKNGSGEYVQKSKGAQKEEIRKSRYKDSLTTSLHEKCRNAE